MPTVNEELHDLSVRHQVNLQRLASGTVSKIIDLLNETDADLVGQIEKLDPSSGSAKRLNAKLAAIREINRGAYSRFGAALVEETLGLASYEAEFSAKMIGKVLPVSIDIVTPSREQLIAAVTSTPFEGGLLDEWVDGLEQGRFKRLQGAIRMGVVEGETTEQIVRRVAGTRALNYKDGILETSRRSAEGLTRTALNHTATAARHELYVANDDLIEEWQFVATLDSKTTPVCQSLDGKVFKIGEGPKPPRHYRCRSADVGVVKSWRDLGIDLDEAPEGTRASMNGQVPASTTYPEWLAKQPRDVVDDVLGKTRADLFLKGELPIEKFVDTTGRSYTLKELRKRESDAFAKAGVEAPAKPKATTTAQRARAAEQAAKAAQAEAEAALKAKAVAEARAAAERVKAEAAKKAAEQAAAKARQEAERKAAEVARVKAQADAAARAKEQAAKKAAELAKAKALELEAAKAASALQRSPDLGHVVDGATKAMAVPKATAVWGPVSPRVAETEQRVAAERAERRLNAAELKVWRSYKRTGHGPWNTNLRENAGEPTGDYTASTATFDTAFAASGHVLTGDMQLARGANYVSGFESVERALAMKGAEWRDHGYFSTTTITRGLESFGDFQENPPAPTVRFVIRAKKGMTVLPGTTSEREFIFPRGTWWRVLDVEVKRGGKHVDVLLEPR